MSTSSSGANATANSSSAANAAGSPSSSESQDVGDSCVWASESLECVTPRTCLDCLNEAVTGDKCAINSLGRCVSVYSLSNAEVEADNYYEYGVDKYCSNDDAECEACRDTWALQYRVLGEITSADVCATSSGCICLASCSISNRHQSIIEAYCSIFGTGSSRVMIFLSLAVGMILVFMIFGLVVRVYLRGYMERQEMERRERRRRSRRREPSGPALQLSAWNSMLDKLIESEQEAAESGKGVTRPKLQQAPSAPGTTPPPSSDDVHIHVPSLTQDGAGG